MRFSPGFRRILRSPDTRSSTTKMMISTTCRSFNRHQQTGLTAEIADGVGRYLAGRTNETMRANLLVRAGQNIHSLFKRDKS